MISRSNVQFVVARRVLKSRWAIQSQSDYKDSDRIELVVLSMADKVVGVVEGVKKLTVPYISAAAQGEFKVHQEAVK